MSKELTKLQDIHTYDPVDPKKLTKKQRMDALNSLMFLIEKRNGAVKERACADGSKQRKWVKYGKEDATPLTCSNEGVMITSTIVAQKERDVTIIDIPSAFLHALTDEEIYMLLRGPIAELMVMVDPSWYYQYITYNSKGQALLYVITNKTLYGLLKSTLQFYKKFRSDIEAYGFKVNPYNPCVAKTDLDSHQMTVTWHVDDLKVSNKYRFKITLFDQYLYTNYGEQMSVKRGQVQDYLGMDLDYSTKGEVKIGMIIYLQKVEDEFPEPILGTAKSPSGKHLLQVRKDTDPQKQYLEETRAVQLHHVVAQLLFVSRCARQDIQTTISFLTSHVKKPGEDDWSKLVHCMKYPKSTKYIKLTLAVDTISIIKWWVDAYHHNHMYYRGHTGSMMSLVKGVGVSYSGKHKLNTKISTESELISSDYMLVKMLWSLYFIQAQGYSVDQKIMHQYNMATMHLEINGSLSSSKRTKHIRARYFLSKIRRTLEKVKFNITPLN